MCIKILDMQFKLQPADHIFSVKYVVRPSKNENIKKVLKWGLFAYSNNLTKKYQIGRETKTFDRNNSNGYFN